MKADLKDWLPNFLSEFHRSQLKPLGFKKERRTFWRDMGAYRECFNFQDDEFNGVAGWRFYLNVGVEFGDLPAREHWSGFPHTLTETIVLACTLRQVTTEASRAVAGEIDQIRERVLAESRKGRS
jgi:hypothetical protein